MDKDEALDLALEALESGDGWRQSDAITAIKQARSASVQEPVAWYRDEDGIRIYYESKVWDDATPLYTNPPAAQRQWVGLTDEELELLNDCGDTDSYKFARAIEAKLKEKNT